VASLAVAVGAPGACAGVAIRTACGGHAGGKIEFAAAAGIPIAAHTLVVVVALLGVAKEAGWSGGVRAVRIAEGRSASGPGQQQEDGQDLCLGRGSHMGRSKKK